MQNKKQKIKRIEYNWYVASDGKESREQFMHFDIEENCELIEEKDGFVFVTTPDEIHRLPLHIINTAIYERDIIVDNGTDKVEKVD